MKNIIIFLAGASIATSVFLGYELWSLSRAVASDEAAITQIVSFINQATRPSPSQAK